MVAHNASYSTGGSSYATGDQMAAYDKLPPSARKALQEAAFNWPATTILARHRKAIKGYRSGREIADTVKHWDRTQHRRDVSLGIVPE